MMAHTQGHFLLKGWVIGQNRWRAYIPSTIRLMAFSNP